MNQLELSEQYEKILFDTVLFKGIASNIRQEILETLDGMVCEIQKGEVIIKQGTACRYLYVLLSGKLHATCIDTMSNDIFIGQVLPKDYFAAPHLFSNNSLVPVTFKASETSVFYMAPKENVLTLMGENQPFLVKFLKLSSNCNKCTDLRLKVLLHKSIRCRFIAYLLSQQIVDDNIFLLEHNQVQLASYLCVARSALSRELKKMEQEDLIKVKGKLVEVKSINKLNKILYP